MIVAMQDGLESRAQTSTEAWVSFTSDAWFSTESSKIKSLLKECKAPVPINLPMKS